MFSLPLAELCQWEVAPEETIMNRLEGLVVVDDAEGKAFICSLDHKLKDFFFGQNRDRKVPSKLEELSKHERRSCTRFFGKTCSCS